MRTTAELDLLEQIYIEMQELKRRMENNQERRIGRQEFAHMLNIEPETLDARIREGRYQKPHKDGRKSFWLRSLPYRQLRKSGVMNCRFTSCSLPYRQLRNLTQQPSKSNIVILQEQAAVQQQSQPISLNLI